MWNYSVSGEQFRHALEKSLKLFVFFPFSFLFPVARHQFCSLSKYRVINVCFNIELRSFALFVPPIFCCCCQFPSNSSLVTTPFSSPQDVCRISLAFHLSLSHFLLSLGQTNRSHPLSHALTSKSGAMRNYIALYLLIRCRSCNSINVRTTMIITIFFSNHFTGRKPLRHKRVTEC